MKLVIATILVALLGLSVLVAFEFASINDSRAKARADNAAVWRAVICRVEDASLNDPKTSPTQREAIVNFWTSVLVDKVKTKPC